jgi:YHS domain-containing protein
MTTVNRICPICGMDVDPSLPPAEYKGHKVGFGCAACPPRFAKDPDMYGPSALKNEVVE